MREEVHPEHGRIAHAAQRLLEPANLQQPREERVDDHADEKRHNHQSAWYTSDEPVDSHVVAVPLASRPIGEVA